MIVTHALIEGVLSCTSWTRNVKSSNMRYTVLCLLLLLVGISSSIGRYTSSPIKLTLKVLVATIDAQWEGMVDVGSSMYEPALLPPCPTIRVLSYSN